MADLLGADLFLAGRLEQTLAAVVYGDRTDSSVC